MEYNYDRHYSRWHDNSEEDFALEGRLAREELGPHLPDDKAALVLEIGCGRGYAIGGLLAAGYTNVRGFDANAGQVRFAKERGLPVDHVPVEITARYLEQFSGRAAFVYAIDVLEHIPQDEVIPVVKLLVDCLKHGGRLYCRVPNGNALLAGRMRYIDFTHYNAFTEASLDFVLFNAGLDAITVQSTRDPPPKLGGALAYWVLRRASRFFTWLMYAAEFGRKEASGIPLTPNIVGTAQRLKPIEAG